MATRTKVPPSIKKKLVREAGDKCANPGCSEFRTHIHHINQWSVYKTHDEEFMIAICPTCHENVHNGKLFIDDDILIKWKHIKREKPVEGKLYDQIFVEHSPKSKILIGQFAIAGDLGVKVFDLSKNNKLSFKIEWDDLYQLNAEIKTRQGIFKVVNNSLKTEIKKPFNYKFRKGKYQVTVPINTGLLPDWAIQQIREKDQSFAIDNQLILLDIEVVEPGTVKVQGIWEEESYILVVTCKLAAIVRLNQTYIQFMMVSGDGYTNFINRSVDKSLFCIV